MGKPKILKEETVNRIKKLSKKYSIEEIWESREFISLSTHYINGYERQHLKSIVAFCYEERSYDEIRLLLNKGEITMSKHNKKENKNNKSESVKEPIINDDGEMDPVEQEVVFMISQQKVIEVDEPVEVNIEEPEIINLSEIENNTDNDEDLDNIETESEEDSVYMISQNKIIGIEKPVETDQKPTETDDNEIRRKEYEEFWLSALEESNTMQGQLERRERTLESARRSYMKYA